MDNTLCFLLKPLKLGSLLLAMKRLLVDSLSNLVKVTIQQMADPALKLLTLSPGPLANDRPETTRVGSLSSMRTLGDSGESLNRRGGDTEHWTGSSLG